MEIKMKYYTKHLSNATSVVTNSEDDTEQVITGLADVDIATSVRCGENAKLADYSYILLLIDKLAARSYALIEACISDKDQQRAFKQSLRGIVDEQRDKAYRELVLGQ